MCSILQSLWLWATLVKVRRELVAFRKLSLLGYLNVFCFLNWANPGLFFVYFRSFQTNNTIFTTNECEKRHVHPVSGAGIRTHDLWNVSLLP